MCYLGTLNCHDPLYDILLSHVCPEVRDPLFHVDKMSSRSVYKYSEERSCTAIIGKFFKLGDTKYDRVTRIKGEYDNLKKIRALGFNTFPHYVVRPIHKEERIGLALIEEFVQGKDLDHYFKRAIYYGEGALLNEKLDKLASFLHAFHAKTETVELIETDPLSLYFQRVLDKLQKQKVVSDGDRKKLLKLMDKWLQRSLLQNVKRNILHGDATPTNFIFTESGDVVAIDLERMRDGDPAFDVGMICGEIKHAFFWRTGNQYYAEPFIKHFLKTYAGFSHNVKSAFRAITYRNPFYMALTELRIARNDYLSPHYKRRLVHEAAECLAWGLKYR